MYSTATQVSHIDTSTGHFLYQHPQQRMPSHSTSTGQQQGTTFMLDVDPEQQVKANTSEPNLSIGTFLALFE